MEKLAQKLFSDYFILIKKHRKMLLKKREI